MSRVLFRASSCFVAVFVNVAGAAPPASEPAKASIVWNLDDLQSIGGRRLTVIGEPRVIETDRGKAIEFDGENDGIFLDANPLAELRQFTAEVIFRPAADGPKEQRFLHFQPDGTDDRLLFETRLTTDGRWFLDTYVQTAVGRQTLYAEQHLHRIGPWYHAAVVVNGETMRHYVNGREEMSAEMRFSPFAAGQTSIGMRFNRVHWYKGAVRQIRITPGILHPNEFLKP